jgi:hypothetical protein
MIAQPPATVKAHTHTPTPVSPLGEKLDTLIAGLPPDGVTLATILDHVGQEGLLLLTVFLTLIFLVPVSIPGVSTVFGFAILMIGISRLFNCPVWMPSRLAHRVLPTDKLRVAFIQGSKWVRRLERVSRPHRLNGLVASHAATFLNNGALILGAALLMAPFGLIPFSNTFPALAILFLAVGLMQKDGLCILLGHCANLLTILYFALLMVGGVAAVLEAVRRLFALASFSLQVCT